MKRSTRQYITVAIICTVVIGAAATITAFLITRQIRDEYQLLLQEAYEDMRANQRNVYIATRDILNGEVIQEDMLERKTVYSSQPQDSYITKEVIGKTALVDIVTGTQVLNAMVTANDVASNIRELEYQVITMNSNILQHDTVDVRIFYPNGESYIVLAKKKIVGYTPESSSVFLWVDEAELLRMSAAIVDAALYTGSKLYVTRYVEPNYQDASVITYTPSLSILSLIENDPNIIERSSQKLNKDIRKSLENRLTDNMTVDIAAIHWDIDSYLFYEDGSSNTNTSQKSLDASINKSNELQNPEGLQDKTQVSSDYDNTQQGVSKTQENNSETQENNSKSQQNNSEISQGNYNTTPNHSDSYFETETAPVEDKQDSTVGSPSYENHELGKADYFYLAEEVMRDEIKYDQ